MAKRSTAIGTDMKVMFVFLALLVFMALSHASSVYSFCPLYLDQPKTIVIDNIAFMFTDTVPYGMEDASGWTCPSEHSQIIYMNRMRVKVDEAYTLCLHEMSHILYPDNSEGDTVQLAQISDYLTCHKLNDTLMNWSMNYR